jgi:tryptophan synthase alpha subunit
MSRLEDVFSRAAVRGELALVAYLTAGDPTPEETVGLVAAAVDAGADVIELGVPFSDPMGDGPALQASNVTAIAAGMTVGRALEAVAEVRRAGIAVPIALRGFCNPFLHYGVTRLLDDAVAAGVDAFVVPDLPANEADEWLEGAAARGLDLVFSTGPDSRPERLAHSAARASGFLHCLAPDAMIGTLEDPDPRLLGYLSDARKATDLPLAVGFEGSSPERLRALRGHADGVIVGTAIVSRIGEEQDADARRTAVHTLVSELKTACRAQGSALAGYGRS